MSVTIRIIQQYDIRNEKEFIALERQFAELERTHADFPKGRRKKPIAAIEPCNTLIWECEFPDLDAAYKTLDFFKWDANHEELYKQQLPFFVMTHIEFLENLDF
jgi:hypothetical protein